MALGNVQGTVAMHDAGLGGFRAGEVVIRGHAVIVVGVAIFGGGCLAASGRQARLRQAAAGAPASLRRTRWRGFGLPLRSDV